MLGLLDSDAAVAAQIRDAALRDLFVLLGTPPAEDHKLQLLARRMLEEHLARIARGDCEPEAAIPDASCNISCLGTLAQIEARDAVHAWGHFIAQPRAYGAAVAEFTAADGVRRVYMATVWQR